MNSFLVHLCAENIALADRDREREREREREIARFCRRVSEFAAALYFGLNSAVSQWYFFPSLCIILLQ